MKWIYKNLHVCWSAAQQGYSEQGRGAMVVDTTAPPTPTGNRFSYMDQAGVERLQDADALRMVKEYDPRWELVTLFFGHKQRASIYRVSIPEARKIAKQRHSM